MTIIDFFKYSNERLLKVSIERVLILRIAAVMPRKSQKSYMQNQLIMLRMVIRLAYSRNTLECITKMRRKLAKYLVFEYDIL